MSDQIRASDWCSAHREWSPCPDCETEDTIARLTRERDMYQAEADTRLHQIEHLRTALAMAHAAVAAERSRDREYQTQIAGLRLMLREVAATNSTGIDYALRCQRERDEARAEAEEAARAYNDVAADLRRTAAELATTQRELHRLIHGTAIEGDGACEHEIHADAARAWARLWHAEARRLWREVQALSDPDAPYAEVDPEEFMREIGGDP